MKLSCRYRFSASHRLHAPGLSPEANRELYGKCNNPYGHGHNYIVDVTVAGPPDETGLVVNRAQLDSLVQERVLRRLDHKNLNCDVPEFACRVPTTENLAEVIRASLEQNWNLAPRLAAVRISETDRNTFAWEANR